MANCITALDVSTNADEEKDLKAKGFKMINVDLNKGTGGNNIFLWYQKGEGNPVTRVQVTFNEEMEDGLKKASYTKIDKNLNAGTSGGSLYMWYSRLTNKNYDVPIVDVIVTTDAKSEAQHLASGGVWEEVSCDLNLGAGGNFVYAWVRRAKPIYICDVKATTTYDQDRDLLSSGYTRVDVNTNLGADGGAEVFIWYRKTVEETESLSDLNISINDTQYGDIQKEGFELVDTNLNENTTGSAVYLWHKKEDSMSKVRGMVLLLNKDAVKTYKAIQGVKVIERNLNAGTRGALIYMCHV